MTPCVGIILGSRTDQFTQMQLTLSRMRRWYHCFVYRCHGFPVDLLRSCPSADFYEGVCCDPTLRHWLKYLFGLTQAAKCGLTDSAPTEKLGSILEQQVRSNSNLAAAAMRCDGRGKICGSALRFVPWPEYTRVCSSLEISVGQSPCFGFVTAENPGIFGLVRCLCKRAERGSMCRLEKSDGSASPVKVSSLLSGR